ncbi:hypothetical protein HYFRA_00012668 [Hymenoscyphus fraxineus]|uniref:AN1-type domain-containing protein n=1 Tax=Hymenoscyphus fraxineus TaxID=746836 RepID=A0A9N9L4L5_9HELO|nr:hypothetical protein HYFRA_00012668 [Hymenoscyphus fraxineus]
MATLLSSKPSDNSIATTEGKDPTLTGSHCQYGPCNQLDFLPYRCESCHNVFCGDHRTESNHKCTKEGEWATRKRLQEIARPSLGAGKLKPDIEKACASPDCKTIIGTSLSIPNHCDKCNRDYCMSHRLNEEHNCAKLVPIGASSGRSFNQRAFISNTFTNIKLSWGKTKTSMTDRVLPKPKPSSPAARLVAVNTLKKTAKGDAKLPAEKRVYLYVEAEAATTKSKLPKGEFFYSKEWAVGRVLDAAAKSLQVENTNNQGEDERSKLRVFYVEGGRLLEFSEKLGSAVASGNTIVLLRGVGPAIPNLIEA